MHVENNNSNLPLLTSDQSAKALSISLQNTGQLPTVRLGRCVRYRSAGLGKYLESKEKGGNRNA